MTTRDEKRIQTLIALGMFAIGVVAFLLDEHPAPTWRQLTMHHWVELVVAAVGLLATPFDVQPVKDKLAVLATVLPWLRRAPTSTYAAAAPVARPQVNDDKPVNDG